jgi:hypothetical protein
MAILGPEAQRLWFDKRPADPGESRSRQGLKFDANQSGDLGDLIDKCDSLSILEDFNGAIELGVWRHHPPEPDLRAGDFLDPVPWLLEQVQIEQEYCRVDTLRDAHRQKGLDARVANFNVSNYMKFIRFGGHGVQPGMPVCAVRDHFSVP